MSINYLKHGEDCCSMKELADKLRIEQGTLLYRIKAANVYDQLIVIFKTNRLERKIAKIREQHNN